MIQLLNYEAPSGHPKGPTGKVRRSDRKPQPPTAKTATRTARDEDVAAQARRLLEANARFRGRSAQFQFEQQPDGRLVVHGCVPSFYLKQLLHVTLKGLEGIQHIDNRVTVKWPERG